MSTNNQELLNKFVCPLEYSLSEKGNSVIDILLQVAKWGTHNNPHSY